MSLYRTMFHLQKSSRNIQHADAILTYNLFFSASIASEYIEKTHSSYTFGRYIRVHFIYLGHVTWVACTIPIWEPTEEAGCAHAPWAYTQWASKNNRTRAALWFCLPVTQIPAACVPVWLTGLKHSLWPYKQSFSQTLSTSFCFATLTHTRGCLLLQLLQLLLVWMWSDFEELTWTQWDGTQCFSMTRREFGAAGFSLTLDKGRLFCLEQNTSATYHLDLFLQQSLPNTDLFLSI